MNITTTNGNGILSNEDDISSLNVRNYCFGSLCFKTEQSFRNVLWIIIIILSLIFICLLIQVFRLILKNKKLFKNLNKNIKHEMNKNNKENSSNDTYTIEMNQQHIKRQITPTPSQGNQSEIYGENGIINDDELITPNDNKYQVNAMKVLSYYIDNGSVISQ